MLMIAPYMGRQKPLHPTSEIAIRIRPQRNMEMIRHDAIGKYAHWNPDAGRANQIHKGLIVSGLMEYLILRVAAIDDVIADASDRGAARSWHTAIYFCHSRRDKGKKECPLFCLKLFSDAVTMNP